MDISMPRGRTALVGLALVAIALWPHWVWATRRLADGSDDPLGLAALTVLAVAIWRLAPSLHPEPRMPWVGLAAVALLAATVAHWVTAPPLLALLLAVLAVAAALCAYLPPRAPRLALLGLALLAMPLIASLQFYAGYPLRLATAELSAWLLRAFGHSVQRSGTALLVGGRMVLVDAPCSGVQMAWMGYFCACTLGWFVQLTDGALARRLAGVGAIVLAGNVLRNSVLVGLEAARSPTSPPLSEAVHESVGLLVLAGVCAAVLRWVNGGRDAPR
jgi:exosortase/archaeosortase family protein